MRISVSMLTAALLLASATAALAQQASTAQPTGRIDFGIRGTDVSGDAARYQRFRDLGDGAFLEVFRWARLEDGWNFTLGADHGGRTDQRYFGAFEKLGTVRVSFEWNQVPLLFSRDTRTLYTTEGSGVLRIADSIQQGIQARQFTITDVIGQARRFDTKNRRDVAAFNLLYTPTRDLDVTFNLKTTKREGNMPWGASFGFSSAVEVAAPMDTRTTDLNTGVEWANERGLVRVGYEASWFNNNIQTLVWDNPLKFTDSTYSTAYSDGRGTSQGRMALWPTSTLHSVSTTGSVKLPSRSRLNANLAIGAWKQDEPIVPYTINSAIPVIPLDRSTAEAEARTVAGNIGFTSRPNQYVWLNARYRYYDFDNRTPHFSVGQYVRFDQALGGPLASGGPEPFSIKRQNFDVDVSFTPVGSTAFKLGYGRADVDRTSRIFEVTKENTLRASVDTTGNQYVTLRAIVERSAREGEGFEQHLLDLVGEQPGMRHYDIANRERTRFSAIVTVTPISALGVNASVSAGNDDYKDSEFGLRDNEHRIYSCGFDVVPRDEVSFGTSYAYERYTALHRSRQASPGAQFVDPQRDWSTDSADRVHTFTSGLDLLKAIPKTDVRVGYDYSWSKSTYLYRQVAPGERTLPDGSPIVSTLVPPQQLPPVTNDLQRGTLDVTYFVTKKVGIGFAYWYDAYRVRDFALGSETISRIDLPAGILLEYLYRPYTAHTGWLRLVYLW